MAVVSLEMSHLCERSLGRGLLVPVGGAWRWWGGGRLC